MAEFFFSSGTCNGVLFGFVFRKPGWGANCPGMKGDWTEELFGFVFIKPGWGADCPVMKGD
jgi:hypothetical protein